MQRLAVSMKNVVSDIHNIVDWTKTYQTQLVLQPVGTLFHGNTFDGNSGITGTCFGIFYFYSDIHIVIVYLEAFYRRTG